MSGSTERQTVDYPSLARQLGLTRRQSEDVLESGVLSPVEPARGRRGTRISPEDAELLEQAMKAVRAAGIAVGIVLVLRLLASGAVKPP
jgi:hypothetical protein